MVGARSVINFQILEVCKNTIRDSGLRVVMTEERILYGYAESATTKNTE